MKHKIIKIKVVLLVFILIFLLVNLNQIKAQDKAQEVLDVGNAQDKIQQEVDNALAFLPRDYSTGVAKFNKIGLKSIPYILKIIFNEKQTTLQKVSINPQLLSIIAQFQSPIAEEGLIKLLNHNSPHIRGDAVYYLGEKKSKKSIPVLVTLLKDEYIYLTENSSNGSEKQILVRDNVVQALEKITDVVLLPQKNYKQKADAWLKWWQEKCKKSLND